MEQNSSTRKEFLQKGAAIAGATAVGAIGFTRVAQAADHEDSTITQTASIGLNPDKKDEARKALTELVNAVEANEPGVLAYIAHFTEDNKVLFFEMYKDEAALANHGQQPHMAKIRDAFGAGILTMPLEIGKLERVVGFYR